MQKRTIPPRNRNLERGGHVHSPTCGCSSCEIAGCNCVDCKCSMEIRDLSVRKKDGFILEHIHLKVTHGEIMAIIGRNGAGKSTLLKAILGRIPYTGTISYTNHRGEPILKPKIGYVPQNLVFDRTSPMTAADTWNIWPSVPAPTDCSPPTVPPIWNRPWRKSTGTPGRCGPSSTP